MLTGHCKPFSASCKEGFQNFFEKFQKKTRGRQNDLHKPAKQGKPAKASYDVKVGDHISIAFGARTVTVEVLAVAEAVRKDDATAMYREV